MRGRTLSNAVVILDEAQNTTSMQMKMFLTRLGEGSKMIVTGDPSQVDLPPGQVSGLAEAYRMLREIDGIVHLKFRAEDVVRHPLVTRDRQSPMTKRPAGGCAPPPSVRRHLLGGDR
jgi:phosphate starvation-inducible PhoH-like protein